MSDRFHEELFSGYLDGELSPDERALVERRLEASADAQRELAELRQVSKWLQELPPQRAPQGLSGDVLQVVGRTMRPGKVRPDSPPGRVTHLWTAGCTVAAMVLVAILLGQRDRDRDGTTLPMGGTAATSSADDLIVAARGRSNADSDEDAVALSMLPADEANRRRLAFETADDGARPVDRHEELGAAFGHVTNSISEWKTPAIAPTPERVAIDGTPLASAGVRTEVAKQLTSYYAFNDGLPREQVGEVVSSMEQGRDRIAVMTLAVADRLAGLQDLQSELGANAILAAPAPALNESEEADAIDADRKAAVYVEATPEQLTSALHALRANGRFHAFRAEPAIALTELDRTTRAQLAWAQSPQAYESAMKFRFDVEAQREQHIVLNQHLERADAKTNSRGRPSAPVDDAAESDKPSPTGAATLDKRDKAVERKFRADVLQRSAVAEALAPQARQVVLFPTGGALKEKSASAAPEAPLAADLEPAEAPAPPAPAKTQPGQGVSQLVRVLLVLEDSPIADQAPVQAPKP